MLNHRASMCIQCLQNNLFGLCSGVNAIETWKMRVGNLPCARFGSTEWEHVFLSWSVNYWVGSSWSETHMLLKKRLTQVSYLYFGSFVSWQRCIDLFKCTGLLDLYFKGSYSILFFNGSVINIRGPEKFLSANIIRVKTNSRSTDIYSWFIKK